MILGPAAGRGESLMPALRQGRAEEGVVLDIEPQHRHPRGPAEIRGRFDQSVWRAVVVRLAVDATYCKGDDRPDLRRVHARQRDGSPAAGGLSDDEVGRTRFLGDHVVDDPDIDQRSGMSMAAAPYPVPTGATTK